MRRLPIIIALALFLSHGAAYALDTDVRAVIVTPLELTALNDGLSFGTFASTRRAGRIGSDGNPGTNGIQRFEDGENARYQVNGQPGASYTVRHDRNVTLTGDEGGATMRARLSKVGGEDALNDTGQDEFAISGDLRVPANQPAGTYTGTYNVTVNY